MQVRTNADPSPADFVYQQLNTGGPDGFAAAIKEQAATPTTGIGDDVATFDGGGATGVIVRVGDGVYRVSGPAARIESAQLSEMATSFVLGLG